MSGSRKGAARDPGLAVARTWDLQHSSASTPSFEPTHVTWRDHDLGKLGPLPCFCSLKSLQCQSLTRTLLWDTADADVEWRSRAHRKGRYPRLRPNNPTSQQHVHKPRALLLVAFPKQSVTLPDVLVQSCLFPCGLQAGGCAAERPLSVQKSGDRGQTVVALRRGRDSCMRLRQRLLLVRGARYAGALRAVLLRDWAHCCCRVPLHRLGPGRCVVLGGAAVHAGLRRLDRQRLVSFPADRQCHAGPQCGGLVWCVATRLMRLLRPPCSCCQFLFCLPGTDTWTSVRGAGVVQCTGLVCVLMLHGLPLE